MEPAWLPGEPLTSRGACEIHKRASLHTYISRIKFSWNQSSNMFIRRAAPQLSRSMLSGGALSRRLPLLHPPVPIAEIRRCDRAAAGVVIIMLLRGKQPAHVKPIRQAFIWRGMPVPRHSVIAATVRRGDIWRGKGQRTRALPDAETLARCLHCRQSAACA
jgi:hypothetical protein